MRRPQWADNYRMVLADAGFRSVLVPALVIKLPVVAIPVALTLQVAVGLGLGFGRAGLLVGTWTLGVAVGSPAQGWLIDRHGLRPVLAVSAVAQAGFWVFAWRMSYPVLAAGAAVSGLTLVSGSAVMRLAVTSVVPEEIRHTAFAVDSVTTEVAYMAGPVLCVLVATQVSVRAATTGIGVLLACGAAALVARLPRTTAAPAGAEARRPSLRSVIRLPLLAALAMTAAASLVVAGYEVAIVASLRHQGNVAWSGLVLAACGVYSLAGGVVFGALRRPVPAALVVAVLGLATAPIGLAAGWPWIVAAVAPATAACAAAGAATANAVTGFAAAGIQASVLGLYSVALAAGSALGAPLAGAAFDAGGSVAAFATVGGISLVVALLAWPLARIPAPGEPPAVTEVLAGAGSPQVSERNEISVNPNVVIVDSYAPTAPLAEEFRRAGTSLVRVQSTPDVPKVYQGPLHLDGYLANLTHQGDVTATAARLRDYRPMAVVPGGEIGVELTDALSAALGTPGNGIELSRARRDKFVMIETVKSAGLAGARQLLVSSEEELAAWHRDVGGRIVVKPLRSAGGDSVFFCDSPDEAAAAYRKIAGAVNIFSVANTGVVAQEYLRGTEYMVNTVSRDGRHHVTDIWRTTRITANGVLDLGDTAYLMPRRGQTQDLLARYAGQVLDALGIRHGPAHVEVKMTSRGPVLVEMGARICGGNLPYYAKVALGESQLDWTVDAYLRPDRFLARWEEDYPAGPAFASVTLISPVSGVLRSYRHLDRLRALESFHDLRVMVKPGQPISQTVDDMGYPLIVTLMHESEETVLRDAGTIRYLDGDGFYDVTPGGSPDDLPGPGAVHGG